MTDESNDIAFLKGFLQDIAKVEEEIPQVIESLEVIGSELEDTEKCCG